MVIFSTFIKFVYCGNELTLENYLKFKKQYTVKFKIFILKLYNGSSIFETF